MIAQSERRMKAPSRMENVEWRPLKSEEETYAVSGSTNDQAHTASRRKRMKDSRRKQYRKIII